MRKPCIVAYIKEVSETYIYATNSKGEIPIYCTTQQISSKQAQDTEKDQNISYLISTTSKHIPIASYKKERFAHMISKVLNQPHPLLWPEIAAAQPEGCRSWVAYQWNKMSNLSQMNEKDIEMLTRTKVQ